MTEYKKSNCRLEGIIKNEKADVILNFFESYAKPFFPCTIGKNKVLGIGKRSCDECDDCVCYGFTRYCKNKKVIWKNANLKELLEK